MNKHKKFNKEVKNAETIKTNSNGFNAIKILDFLKNNVSETEATKIAEELQAICIKNSDGFVLITASTVKELPAGYAQVVEQRCVFPHDIQLSSRASMLETRHINTGTVSLD